MVTGFNTDIKFNDVVYHIQTEPRKEFGIETTVYVKGAVIHSFRSSYQELLNSPDYSEDKLKRMLEDQHRQVIARIRGGEIRPPAPPAQST
jgi:ribosome-associated translation inhibitor RaiA